MTPIEINKVLHDVADFDNSLFDEYILGLSTNSKEVSPGFIFIAISGSKFDGNSFIDEALANGAICVISDSKDIEQSKKIIKVEDARESLGKISANFYNNPQDKIKIIGVTGTNGKTSTTLILKSILESHGKKVLQIGTLGIIPNIANEDFGLTTPDSVNIFKVLSLAVEQKYDFAILEVSSHALSEKRIDNLRFDFAGFTNLSLDHLDYHGTIDNYFNEKKKLFGLVKDSGSSLILSDSSYGKDICNEYPNTNNISLNSNEADFYCSDFTLDHKGASATFNFQGISIDISSKLVGKYNLENIILAASIAFKIGVDINSIRDGIASCKSIPGRYETISNKGPAVIISDYGHTPDAYTNVLKSLRDIYNDKNIKVLFGAGGNRDKSKRPEMAKAVEGFATQCYLAPDNPRFDDINDINSQVIEGFSKEIYTVFHDREAGLIAALTDLTDSDVLVIFGKGNEEYQEISGKKLYYSDRKIIEEFYES
tara:strand:- start:5801 stop:7252 length:1452 start_codon:yes stop_codon:yes gene_type:complete